MKQRKLHRAATYAVAALVWTIGCDERVVEVAREAADRQAAQNEQMGELQKEVAQSTRTLVEADAAARREIVGVHRDLQAERRQLGNGWNKLESQRQQAARQRRTESVLVPAMSAAAGVVLVMVLLSFLRQLLASSQSTALVDAEFQDLLVEQVFDIESRTDTRAGQGTEIGISIARSQSKS